MNKLQDLSEKYLAIKAQIDALEGEQADIKEQIDLEVSARISARISTEKKWVFPVSEVVYVEPSRRSSISTPLLIQQGVTADVIKKATIEKEVKGYTKVSARKSE